MAKLKLGRRDVCHGDAGRAAISRDHHAGLQSAIRWCRERERDLLRRIASLDDRGRGIVARPGDRDARARRRRPGYEADHLFETQLVAARRGGRDAIERTHLGDAGMHGDERHARVRQRDSMHSRSPGIGARSHTTAAVQRRASAGDATVSARAATCTPRSMGVVVTRNASNPLPGERARASAYASCTPPPSVRSTRAAPRAAQSVV